MLKAEQFQIGRLESMKAFKRFFRARAIEYGLIAAGISVVVITVVRVLSGN
jgi:Flp pilus assembly pilin Flp